MSRFILSLAVFMLAASLVSAQKNALSKGYVVTIHNDTLPGFVVDRDWSVNPGDYL